MKSTEVSLGAFSSQFKAWLKQDEWPLSLIIIPAEQYYVTHVFLLYSWNCHGGSKCTINTPLDLIYISEILQTMM